MSPVTDQEEANSFLRPTSPRLLFRVDLRVKAIVDNLSPIRIKVGQNIIGFNAILVLVLELRQRIIILGTKCHPKGYCGVG